MFSSQIIQDFYSIHPSPNSISAVPHHHLIVKFQSRVTVPHSTRTVSHLRGVSRRYVGGQGMYTTAFQPLKFIESSLIQNNMANFIKIY